MKRFEMTAILLGMTLSEIVQVGIYKIRRNIRAHKGKRLSQDAAIRRLNVTQPTPEFREAIESVSCLLIELVEHDFILIKFYNDKFSVSKSF